LAERVLRVFVSSPSDVAGERARVKLVADRLNGELAGLVRLDILRWEDGFYTAAHSFQEAIDAAIGNMIATDMVLCIVWKRAGLKLNPAIWQRSDGSSYESGTVLEFETAVDVSRKHEGVPDVYLFRKTADVLLRADKANEEMEQYQLLQSVWKRWTESAEGYNTAGYQSFVDADDFEGKLEACLRQWLARRGVMASGPFWDRTLKGSPFRGLAAFEAPHASVFFGREAAIARATAKLRQAPFLLLIGGSGSGKSSLLRAGLIPRVTAPGVIPDVDLWRSATIVPSGDPLAQLADALFADDALGAELRAGDFSNPALLAELFAAGSKAALAPIRTALARAAQARKEALRYDAPRPVRLAIAVDQVERLFVEVAPERVDAFAGLLRGLVEADLASVIAALRSDTYGRFQAVSAFLALLEKHGATLDLLSPSHNELEDIVTRPVAACHPPLTYEIDAQGRPLAEILVADARGGDALPLLQMTLQRLFDAEATRGDGLLRFADYPGMDAAVTRAAEEAVAGLSTGARAGLPNLLTAFVRDVTIDENGGLQSLSIVPVERATYERGDPGRKALIDEFVARRLLTVEEADGAVRVRPVHEALLRVVPAAVAIIKENAALIRVRHTLEPMVAEWRQAPAAMKADFLATSPALIAGAAQLSERFGAELPDDMRAFVADSLAADARRREAERTHARRIIMATAAGLVMALCLAGFAGWQWKVASEQRQAAELQQTLAEGARQEAQANADKALRNFHASADQAETLIVTLGGKFKTHPGVTREALKTILTEGQRQIEALGSQDPKDHYVAQVRAKAIVNIADTYIDLGDIAAAKSVLGTCIRDIKPVPREQWDWMDRHIVLLCYTAASKLATAEGNINAALGIAEEALDLALENAAKGDNPDAPEEAAFALTQVGDLLVASGQIELAQKRYEQALDLRRMIMASRNESQSRERLSIAFDRIGKIADLQLKFDEALTAYREALDLLRAVFDETPENTQLMEGVSIAYAKVAVVLARSGRFAEAVNYSRPSLELRERLVESDPTNWHWRTLLAESNNRLAIALANSGKLNEAIPLFRESIQRYRAIVAHDPINVVSRHDLAIALNQFAFAVSSNDRATALEAFHESLPIFRELAAGDSVPPSALIDLAITLTSVAEAGYAVRMNYEEALSLYLQLDQKGLLPPQLQVMLPSLKTALERLPKP
jgi:tetratricopeptide (TPR) repeat protein/energy-coupling factor transporter ATP-binding protein EcfA2